MRLIIGLGNPGKEYLKTRHNAGFIILDALRETWNFSDFKLEKKFFAELSEGSINGEKIILAKPQTFMNASGQSVRALMDFFKLSPEDIIIIHDDLDIDFSVFKVSTDSSAGGHNGIIDIIEKLGTQKFKRMRIGIEGTEAKKTRLMSGKDFVLQNFSEAELQTLKDLAIEISKEL